MTDAVTATSWLRDLVRAYDDAEALIVPDEASRSFRQLDERAASVAGVLRAAGLGRGDRLACLLPNGMLAIEVILAAARLGAVVVGINTRLRAVDLGHVLQRSQARLLVSAHDFLGIDLRPLVAEATAYLAQPPAVLWATDVEAAGTAPSVSADAASPDDLFVAFTTSGTTGHPKLAAHDHATTIRHLRAAQLSLEVTPRSTALLSLPLCGTFGFVTALAVLSGGGRVVIQPRFDAAEAARYVERYGVTHFNGSDDMIIDVMSAGADLSPWRHGVQAEFTGRGMEAVRRAEQAGCRLTGVYGSSETFALLARWSPEAPAEARGRNGGILVDSANEARVVDGELQIRGPSVLSAYLDETGTTPPALVEGAWLATGDLAIEEDGGFVYLARLDDALRLRGFLTDPVEIEQHIMAYPGVTGAQVVGTEGAHGEIAVAFLTGSEELTEADLIAHCRRGLANYKVPDRVVVLDEFPTVDGANGVKIQKVELRRRAAALVNGCIE